MKNVQLSSQKSCLSSGWSPPPAVLGIFSTNVDLGRSYICSPASRRLPSADICLSPEGGAVTQLQRIWEYC